MDLRKHKEAKNKTYFAIIFMIGCGLAAVSKICQSIVEVARNEVSC